jgi:hypothetical protein
MKAQEMQTASHESMDSTVKTKTATSNVLQLLAICVASVAFATSSIASAQT